MITIERIETALKNAGWKYKTKKIDFVDMGLKYFLQYECPNNHFKFTFRQDLDIETILSMMMHFIEIEECYFFKKHHIEYSTINYGINELIEDLKLWL